METRFTIEAEPVPASRPRVTRSGAVYYPKKHTAYAETLKTLLGGVSPMTLETPVEVRMLFVMPRYKTSDFPVHRADVDNLSKLPMDCMTKATHEDKPKFWTDDCLVVSLKAYKRFAREGEQPHTKVRVIPIEGSVEDHIDRSFESE